jgi:hypothetical protein
LGNGAFQNTPWYDSWYESWYNSQPDGVVYINKIAYRYKGIMPENTSITIKDGTLGINPAAFSYCTNLTSITLPEGLISIGSRAFENCNHLYSITIPNTVETIGEYAFWNCYNLTSCNIPNNLKCIEEATFGHCSIISIEIPYGVTSIGTEAFASNNLESLTLSNSVTSIGASAFRSNFHLSKINIPSSVTSIDEAAFEYCNELTSVTVNKKEPITLNSSVVVFSNSANATLYVPKGSKQAYANADHWKDFKNIEEMESEILGDANGDWDVDTSDILTIQDFIMTGNDKGFYFNNADMNDDKKVDAADIVLLVNIIK